MILDPDALRAGQRDRRLVEDSPDGDIKPELMESVLEISTKPCADMREAAPRCARCDVRFATSPTRRACASARPARTRSRAGRTSGSPPRRAIATSSKRCASSPARRSSSGCTSTSGSTIPTRRSTSPTGCACTCRSCSRCQRQLAVLARRRHRPGLDADADLPRVPARRHPALLRRLGRLRAPDRLHGRDGRDGGLHLALVRRPPAPELRHGRDPGDGRADPRRAHARRWRR